MVCEGAGYLLSAGRPTNLDNSSTSAYCACSKCDGGCTKQSSTQFQTGFTSESVVTYINASGCIF